ncbi:hypothetical protein RHGRI_030073 [Rhododendron griersonianum]|uniref:Serine hydrolase domain-containing protein n=1 Tax=Rhododendron griersonianum TaxID=479676 RepID=A0AAV6IM54_9ERIC|nr:hypothetical protein RHGRI_030073 [Rhododendron griersonianum]
MSSIKLAAVGSHLKPINIKPSFPTYWKPKFFKKATQIQNKPRFLCLHGFRTSAEILRKQLRRWPETVLGKWDLVFIDGPFLAQGESGVERFYSPPYYEWFQFSQDYQEAYNFEECLAYIEDYMVRNGPFDGVMGFSQGAILSAAMPGMQLDGVALTKVPRIKCVIIMSGAKFGGSNFGSPKLAANAFSSPLKCPSLHIIGEADLLKEQGIELLESFIDPFVIHHSKGHTIARLDEKGLKTILSFIETIEKMHRQQE